MTKRNMRELIALALISATLPMWGQSASRDNYFASQKELAQHSLVWTHLESNLNQIAGSARIGIGFKGTVTASSMQVQGCTAAGSCQPLAAVNGTAGLTTLVAGPWDSYSVIATWTGNATAANLSFTGFQATVAGGDSSGGGSGTPGQQGIPGVAATIQVGTVTTGTTASVTNVGTATAAILNFVIPAGSGGTTTPSQAATPACSPATGNFSATQYLTCTTATPGGLIYYTSSTSGTAPADPTSASTLYSGAITVATSTIYKFIAAAQGHTNSAALLDSLTITGGTAGTVQPSAMSTGQLAALNGYKPFPGSAWYQSVANSPIDTTPNPNGTTTDGTSATPVMTMDAAWRAQFGARYLHFDPSFPYTVVDSAQTPATVRVSLGESASQSDDVLIPYNSNVAVEGYTGQCQTAAGDGHSLMLDKNTGFEYEGYHFYPCPGKYFADSLTMWDMQDDYSNYATKRVWGWTSADAAGLPIFPGLITRDQVLHPVAAQLADGTTVMTLGHAIRGTMQCSRGGKYNNNRFGQSLFILPATHGAIHTEGIGSGNCLTYAGQRWRLKSTFSTSSYDANQKILLNTMKVYGVINTDNGGTGYITATPDPAFGDDLLSGLNAITLDQMEVVQATTQPSLGGPNAPLLDPDNGPIISAPGTPNVVLSNSSIAAGSCATVSATTTGATHLFVVGGAALRGGAPGILCPLQTTTYSVAADNPGGRTMSNPFTLTVTGTPAATPTVNPAGASYNINQNAVASCSDPNCVVHYTIDGSTPTPDNSTMPNPLPITSNTTLKTVSVAPGMLVSAVRTDTYLIGAAESPVISPASGQVNSGQTFTLSTTTPGASIRYALASTVTCSTGNTYSGPVAVTASTPVAAITCASGYNPSNLTTANYTVSGSTPIPLASFGYAGDSGSVTTHTGSSLLIATTWNGGYSDLPTSMTCGTKNATLVSGPTAVAQSKNAPYWFAAVYFIQNPDVGTYNCIRVYPHGVDGVTHALEVSGTSGIEGLATLSGPTGSGAFPAITTAGDKRLGYVFAFQPGGSEGDNPPAGYANNYSGGGWGTSTIAIPSAGSIILAEQYDSQAGPNTGGIALTLKP